MRLVDWSLLVVLSVLWGGSFFFVGTAVASLPPLTIVALRVGIAALALHLLLPLIGVRFPLDRRVWAVFLGMGVLNNAIPFALIVWGQTQIASGLASILNAATPFSAVVVAHFLTRDEKLTLRRTVGITVAFAGVVVVIGPDALGGVGVGTLAQLAVLGATVSYAFAGVFGRRFRQMGVAPLVAAVGQLTASTALLVPLAVVVDRPWELSAPGLDTALAMVALALLSTALAYAVYFRILASAGAVNVLLVTLLVPVTAIILGSVFLDEQLAVWHFAGMAALAVGLAIVDGRLLRVLRARFGRQDETV